MMKRIVCLILTATAVAACNGPRNIPDDELIAITREIFLANAYRGSTISRSVLPADSIDIYTPIFEKHGYRPSDFGYTIKNLSRRKSVRFTDIIDEVAAQLAREDSLLKGRVALLDTIDQRVDNRYRQVVYTDSLRRITKPGDPDEADITIPVHPGRYRIEFVYDLDTSDRNSYIQYAHHVVDTADVKSNFYYRGYAKGTRKRESFDFTLLEPTEGKLRISLASINTKNKEKPKTSLSIDSLRITYFLPREQAIDSLWREMLPFHPLLPDGTQEKHRTDDRILKEIVRPRDLDSAGIAARGDTLVRR